MILDEPPPAKKTRQTPTGTETEGPRAKKSRVYIPASALIYKGNMYCDIIHVNRKEIQKKY